MSFVTHGMQKKKEERKKIDEWRMWVTWKWVTLSEQRGESKPKWLKANRNSKHSFDKNIMENGNFPWFQWYITSMAL